MVSEARNIHKVRYNNNLISYQIKINGTRITRTKRIFRLDTLFIFFRENSLNLCYPRSI